jgi:hypothetical protein
MKEQYEKGVERAGRKVVRQYWALFAAKGTSKAHELIEKRVSQLCGHCADASVYLKILAYAEKVCR